MSRRSVKAMIDFLSPLLLVNGIGEKREKAFKESGLENVGDLLYYLPLRYIDRRNIIPIKKIGDFLDKYCTIKGTVERLQIEKGRKSRLRILLCDDTGSIELLWFNGIIQYSKIIHKGDILIATGKISRFTSFQMVHPIIEKVSPLKENSYLPVLPLYSLTSEMRDSGINQSFLRKTIMWILKNCKHYPKTLPEVFEKKYNLPPLAISFKNLHFPDNLKEIEKYRKRIQIEEIFLFAKNLLLNRKKFQKEGRSLSSGGLKESLLKNLPFALTEGQSKAIELLLSDCASPKRMHRLLQGDVGCGKTVVALFATLPSLNEGLQVVWMAPTEVLARQSWEKINNFLKPLGFSAELLTSATKNRELYERIRNGISKFIVGT
ncbi:MAG: DEAD/DEAH box helicase, partial [Chitinispirillaceae bacterium]|nr:DEAD/DEAH box helicase [Chitinispirillaceae bacterium]